MMKQKFESLARELLELVALNSDKTKATIQDNYGEWVIIAELRNKNNYDVFIRCKMLNGNLMKTKFKHVK